MKLFLVQVSVEMMVVAEDKRAAEHVAEGVVSVEDGGAPVVSDYCCEVLHVEDIPEAWIGAFPYNNLPFSKQKEIQDITCEKWVTP